jgi:hypothetical protein
MASTREPETKTLSEIIDEMEELRERLLGLQRDLEKMEPADTQPMEIRETRLEKGVQ